MINFLYYNLIGWNSVLISDIFNCCNANINGMLNSGNGVNANGNSEHTIYVCSIKHEFGLVCMFA